MTDRTGRCLCGAVTIKAKDIKRGFGACHCKMCQRWSGAALLAVTVPKDAFEVTGREHVRTVQSSAWAERAWCNECGSSLWYRETAEDAEGTFEVPLGLFDDTEGFVLEHELFVDQKSDAFALKGDHERLTEADVLRKYGLQAASTA
ncbi:GFA family protein [Roseivivax sediminis]|uniref:Uncharacterized conserved protein n=1 Tax=Roseivivax sediminis TaxID=936889 RepID=A0A1I2AZ14_9RHOB|nr:GFA family protein [Roseivivax sediminis]SFE49009.1 Uncharacterized conserved protein [Roseivivax sediminis]